MQFIRDKYYLCVGDYILDECQTQQKKRNQFLECMKAIEFSDRRFRCSGTTITRPTNGWYNSDYINRYDEEYVIVPRFMTGRFYKCEIPGYLKDDNGHGIMITDENVGNFLLADTNIDSITQKFIEKVKEKHIDIEICPQTIELDSLSLDLIKEGKSIGDIGIWFKITAKGYGFYYHSMYVRKSDADTRDAIYDIWKKCRINSGQCRLVRNSLTSTKDKFRRRYSSFVPSFVDYRWL